MREKELRLALVCYGGISLAVYMHGITKEVWHLVRASRAHHQGEPIAGGSAAVYAALIDEIEAEGGLRLRILADIVAGASAGGINGIFLGQAIATGQSLDPLTELWLTSADVEALIDPEAAPASRLSKLWALPLAWMAAGRSADTVERLDDERTRDEVRAKLSHFVRSRWFEPPFGGKTFTNLLLDAFDAMAAAPRGPRLLPPGQPLDLFVTVTDFTGHPERLPLNSPPEVVETEHRLVLDFSDHGEATASIAPIPELAFAARATSSFPGAFPPFQVTELDAVLADRERSWPERRAFLRRILPRQSAANQADKAVLIDGSVLANAPFRPAIDALKERPARREIDRRFVYIDPAPGQKIRLTGNGGQPGFFQTILGSLSDLPRQQPIRDNLDALAQRSARIDRMRGIVTALRPEVEDEIERVFGHTFFLDHPTAARLVAWRRRAQQAAAERAGFAYAAYGHLKLAGVVETITQLLYRAGGEPGRARWRRIRSAIETAIATKGFGDAGPSFAGKESAATIDFLRRYDLGFRIRRLRLMARRVAEMEAERDDLGPIRDAIYAALSAYLDRQRVDDHRELRPLVRQLRADDADGLLTALSDALDLTGLDAATDERLAEGLVALNREPRRALLLTYLGFPYFDTATLPLLQGEGLDEFDPVKVDRIAPDDATAIRSGGAEATLKGIQFNNFGAFFSRAYRENDYLWGRLHGAERMIDITVSTLPRSVRLRPGRVAAIKRATFLAILTEEEPRLTAIQPLFAKLRQEIG
ncbi:patatin-related protein [Sphingomonas jinjuensis]|uniref:Patatin-related protein n=1 Tax=Sphingomonas jinjuensis TaxID=535907 RepID=A0A840FA10_9SPHN|nr:patatin-like protein [Sphingomonas jinjuensis]MBB4153126.1 patatin-related protein [Sphingomonas jinjuensis]